LGVSADGGGEGLFGEGPRSNVLIKGTWGGRLERSDHKKNA